MRARIAAGLLAAGAVFASAPATQAKWQTLHSEPWLHPPVVSVSGADPDPQSGDVFVDVQNSIQAGPMILDGSGRLIWFKPANHLPAFNVEVQTYQGQSVITYWQGSFLSLGVNQGVDLLLNHNYQTVATVRGGNGLHPDLHEFQITPQGTALIVADKLSYLNLSAIGGPGRAPVDDQVLQEDDIASKKVLWQWDVYQHIPITDTYATGPIGASYDPFHVNSIQELPNGNVLISIRHTWAVYEISKRTGKIVWQLGGKRSSFRMGPGTQFEWQHDAHLNGNTLTVFDNGVGPGPEHEGQSRALQIRLDLKNRRASLVHAFTNTPSVLSPNEGSEQSLADGNTFVGWGGAPYISEFAPAGRQLFSIRLPGPLQSYRAYRFPWWGQPTTPPSISVSPGSSGATVYASWNGATTVGYWQVLAGPAPNQLAPVGQLPDTSFETAIPVFSVGPYYAVQALGFAGQVLMTSPTINSAGR